MVQRLIVIGGGASGFFCAINAAMLNPKLNIIILEKQKSVLQKVKVSGGGRCNLTHACFQLSTLVNHYPRGKNFLKKTLAAFSPKDTIQWFQEQGVEVHQEQDGRVFPTTNDSQTILQCFLNLANQFNIQIKINTEIISIQKQDNTFLLHDKNAKNYQANYVMVATGGYSKSIYFDWLVAMGHHFTKPVPSLFTFNIKNKHLTQLMGLSVEQATVKISGTKLSEQGSLLITHWGLSGPVVLRLSAWAARILHDMNYHFQIQVNWLGIPESELREKWNSIRNKQSGQLLSSKTPFNLPQRLWIFILQQAHINPEMKWSELNSKSQNKLIHTLTAQEFLVEGKTTFKEEFVTCGGIELSEVDAQTMQSIIVENLFFGGEILDVDGITGGFNFQHAWSSGIIAARTIAKKV